MVMSKLGVDFTDDELNEMVLEADIGKTIFMLNFNLFYLRINKARNIQDVLTHIKSAATLSPLGS